jgi:hypothetical protein
VLSIDREALSIHCGLLSIHRGVLSIHRAMLSIHRGVLSIRWAISETVIIASWVGITYYLIGKSNHRSG